MCAGDLGPSVFVQVIQALEQLERLSLQREQENAALHELRKTVERLETEKAERAAEKVRFEKVGHRLYVFMCR